MQINDIKNSIPLAPKLDNGNGYQNGDIDGANSAQDQDKYEIEYISMEDSLLAPGRVLLFVCLSIL
jgi:hypothetical protein